MVDKLEKGRSKEAIEAVNLMASLATAGDVLLFKEQSRKSHKVLAQKKAATAAAFFCRCPIVIV